MPCARKYDGHDEDKLPECLKQAKLLGFNGILFPWWEHHVGYQPWRVLTPDILHGLHRLFRDNPFRWIQNLVHKKEYDRRLDLK